MSVVFTNAHFSTRETRERRFVDHRSLVYIAYLIETDDLSFAPEHSRTQQYSRVRSKRQILWYLKTNKLQTE